MDFANGMASNRPTWRIRLSTQDPSWDFVHQGPTNCKGLLYLYEFGASGEALDVEVKCDGCGMRRRLGQAISQYLTNATRRDLRTRSVSGHAVYFKNAIQS